MVGFSDLWNKSKGYVNFIGWKSGFIKRQCRNTFLAEAQGVTSGTEEGVKLRAFLARQYGQSEQHDLETVCQRGRRHVWLTDCQSLRNYLANPIVAGCEDKGIEIYFDRLREYVWDKPDGTVKEDIQSMGQSEVD
eukprot:4180211-Karenia_brevis.AAC.1